MDDMPKELRVVMDKMCSYVGVSSYDINPKEKGWYNKHSWTLIEQDEFGEWFVDYLYNDKEARNVILTTGKRNVPKYKLRRAVLDFILNYGFSIKNGNE